MFREYHKKDGVKRIRKELSEDWEDYIFKLTDKIELYGETVNKIVSLKDNWLIIPCYDEAKILSQNATTLGGKIRIYEIYLTDSNNKRNRGTMYVDMMVASELKDIPEDHEMIKGIGYEKKDELSSFVAKSYELKFEEDFDEDNIVIAYRFSDFVIV